MYTSHCLRTKNITPGLRRFSIPGVRVTSNGRIAAEADLHIQCGKGYYRLRLDGDHFFRLPFEQPLQAGTYCMTYRSISALGRGESVVCVDGLDLFEMLDWNIALS